ncbi:MAG: PAS domain S-box protein [Deltaproteobacteria bacterium]
MDRTTPAEPVAAVELDESAARALRESEERYRALFNGLTDAALVLYEDALGPGDRLVEVNDAACRLYGYSREQLLSMGRGDLVEASLIPSPDALAARVDHESMWESIHRARDGRAIPVEVSARQLVLNGRPAVMFTAHDVSARKEAEQTLRDTEHWLSESQGASRIGSYAFDFTTGLWKSSAVLDEIFGIGPDHPHDYEAWVAVLHPLDRQSMIEYFQNEVIGRLQPFNREYRVQRPDGRVLWVLGLGAVSCDAQGRPAIMSGTIQDITARKEAAETIRANEERLRNILEGFPDMVFVVDADGRVEFVNERAARLMRSGDGERTLADFFAPGDVARGLASIRSVIAGAVYTPIEREYALPGRPPVWLETRLIPFGTGRRGTPLVLGLARDVTDRRRADIERSAIEARLLHAQKLEALGVLAGGIAHDFNNLLAGLFGYIELAHADSPPGSTAAQCLESATQVFARAKSLTQQLLTFAKGGTPHVKATPFERLLRENVNFALSGSAVAARFELDPDIGSCLCDPDQMGQVIDNLTINAKQAMPGGGVLTVRVRMRHVSAGEHPGLAAGNWLEASFIDRGPGIPKELQARIFEPFFTTKSQGSGLGLATSYSILRRHKGLLEVESEPGNGSTFRLFLPAASPDALAIEQPRPSLAFRGRVLVMDDEEALRDVLRAMLAHLGCDATLAADAGSANGALAKAVAEGRPYALLILDLTIPGGPGGKDLLADLRRRGDATPAMAISGYSDDPVMAHPEQFGFAAALAKPFNLAALGAALTRLLAKPG